MTKKLIDLKAPRPRFARSINVERDAGSSAIDGYLPVGRAIDALDRLATALGRNDVEVALSITGPYGSGKSSLAIIIDALLGPKDDPARRAAEELLVDVAPRTLERLHLALERLGKLDEAETLDRENDYAGLAEPITMVRRHAEEAFAGPTMLEPQLLEEG